MKSMKFIILLITILITSCSNQVSEEKTLSDAQKLLENNEVLETIRVMREFIFTHPDSYEGHILLGRAYYMHPDSNDKNLYIARFYFNKAKSLTDEKEKIFEANRQYEQIRLLMNGDDANADESFESAENSEEIGDYKMAFTIGTFAFNKYIEEYEYDKAIECLNLIERVSVNLTSPVNSGSYTIKKLALLLIEDEIDEYDDLQQTISSLNQKTKKSIYQSTLFKIVNKSKTFLDIKKEGTYLILNGEVPTEKKKFIQNNIDKLISTSEEYLGQNDCKKVEIILAASIFEMLFKHLYELDLHSESKKVFDNTVEIYTKAGLPDEVYRIRKEFCKT